MICFTSGVLAQIQLQPGSQNPRFVTPPTTPQQLTTQTHNQGPRLKPVSKGISEFTVNTDGESAPVVMPMNCSLVLNLSGSDENCSGSADGTATVSVLNATPPLSYNWTGPNGFALSGRSISGLAAGTYFVMVTDSNLCMASGSITVGTALDTLAPVLQNVPADTLVDCDTPVPTTHPVTVADNCPGSFLFAQNSITVNECQPGLAAWWPGEGNGSSSTGFFNGLLQNGTSFAQGQVGDAFALDGVNDFILVDTDVPMSGKSYSMVFWFNTSDTSQQALVSASDTVNGIPRLMLGFNSNGQIEYLHRPDLNIAGTKITTSKVYTDGNWHQLTVVKTDTVMRLWVDGIRVGREIDSLDLNGVFRVSIGRLSWANFGSNNIEYNGLLDEARVYNTALCPQERQALLQTTQNGVWAPNFVLTRIFTAIDAAGNSSTATQVITFEDLSPPVLSLPDNDTLYCNGNGGFADNSPEIRRFLRAASADDNCSCVILTYATPSFFPAACGNGSVTLINFSATDACGNLASDVRTITVIDTSGPDLTCPGPITTSVDPGQCGAVVNFHAGAVDQCAGDTLNVNYSIAPGSFFPVGTTPVTITSADSCGNTSSCTFQVTVTAPALNLSVSANTFTCGSGVSCFGATDGSATATASGGCGNRSFQWSNGQTGPNLSNVGAGTYFVTLTDGGGSTVVDSVVITEPAELLLVSSVQNESCNGLADGSIDLSITGGASCQAYNIQWTGPNGFTSTTEDISQLAPGSYSVTITDANGCTVSATGTIQAGEVVSAQLSCCADQAIAFGDTAYLEVTLEGTAPWGVQFSDGQLTRTVIATSSPFMIPVNPTATTTYELVSVSSVNGCFGPVCGKATVGVNDGCSPDTASCNRLLTFNADDAGNGIPAGTVLSNQFAGMGITVSATNAHGSHPDKAIIFDSHNPTGNDPDLGTPNAAFGGPGVGTGGAAGQVGVNNRALGNLIIIAENDVDANNDGRVDVPDDEARGGEIRMDFAVPFYIESVTLVDLDEPNPGSVLVCDLEGGGTRTITIPYLGDNSVHTLPIQQAGVTDIRIQLSGSGGLAEMVYCPETDGLGVHATVTDVRELGTCREVDLEFTCETASLTNLDFIDVSIPCGQVDTVFTDIGLVSGQITNDPLSGLSGVRVQSPPTCGGGGNTTFTLTYRVCSNGATCYDAFCEPLLAYIGGGCVRYEDAQPLNGSKTSQPAQAGVQDQTEAGFEADPVRLQVWPNPTNGKVQFRLEGGEHESVKVELMDVVGHKLAHQITEGEAAVFQGSFDLSDYSRGIYFLKLVQGDRTWSRRIVLQ